MSVDYGSKIRKDFIKLILKGAEKLGQAKDLFEVIDFVYEENNVPMLEQNKHRVNACFVAIWQKLGEIKITLAEDKHGRVRR